MADLFPIAGQKIFIGDATPSQADDFVAGDFSGITWVEIDGWATSGAAGDNANLITQPLINRGRDIKLKGTANAGQMQNQFAVLAGDAGQEDLIAAAAASDKNNYAFKIEGNESGVTSVSQRLFIGLVMSASETGGDANTARMLDVTIEINSNIVSVPAVA